MESGDNALTGYELKMLKASLTRAEELLSRVQVTLQNCCNRLETLMRSVERVKP